jgi:hypothetical protein
MPDALGNATPQEVIAAIQAQRSKNFYQAQASGNRGVQAGASLAAIFGGPLKTTLDTRRARKDEAARLMKTQGMSEEQAMEEAKATIGRDRAEVRRAKQVQEASQDMQTFMDGLPAHIPTDMRMAQAKLMMSNRMRSMGLTAEANNLSLQAYEEIEAAEQAALERENLKARTRASTASAAKTEAETPFVGATAFMQNVMQKEQIIARLNDPNTQLTPEQRDSLMRAKGHLEAKILKDETITGRTTEDVRNDPVLMRKLFAEVADSQVLINEINAAEEMLGELSAFDSTVFASLGKDFLGFSEKWFGRKPTESEREFMDRIIEKEGKAGIIAAKIRHALTGAQMSAFEIVYLQPFLPGPEDSVEQIRGKMRVIKDYTQIDVDTRMELFRNGLTERFLENAGSGTQSPEQTVADVSPETQVAPSSVAATADGNLEAEIRRRLNPNE